MMDIIFKLVTWDRCVHFFSGKIREERFYDYSAKRQSLSVPNESLFSHYHSHDDNSDKQQSVFRVTHYAIGHVMQERNFGKD